MRSGDKEMKFWTNNEIDLLEQKYENTPSREMGILLGRSWRSVSHKAEKLGLKRNIQRNHPNINFFNYLLPIQRAYIAGILDGEGSITLWKNPKKNNKPNVLIRIINTDKNLLHYLLKVIKVGSVYKVKTSPNAFKSNLQVYQWAVNGTYTAKNFLNILMPYLIIKRSKAEKALKLIEDWEVIKNGNKKKSINRKMVI
jgi:hypothetical protein